MGLVGWADAPNVDDDNNSNVRTPATVPVDISLQPDPENQNDSENTHNDKVMIIDELTESIIEHDDSAEDAKEIEQDINLTIEPIEESDEQMPNSDATVEDELFTVISMLKLRQGASDNIYDISKIELHEVLFILDHATRTKDIDYYKLARAMHKIKRQLIDYELPPDLIESPNLDELIEYVEKKYLDSLESE